jgi:hypothetical protein
MSSYNETRKNYYLSHKDEIAQKEKDKKRWKGDDSYYNTHKEEMREKARARYYTKKGLPVPERKTPRVIKISDDERKKRDERIIELLSELNTIAPGVINKRYLKKSDGLKAGTEEGIEEKVPDIPAE